MVLTSWLSTYNQAIDRIAGEPLVTENDSTKEGRLVRLFWPQVLEDVLLQHEWPVATKMVYLGKDNALVNPTIPVGLTETDNKTQWYGFAIPAYDGGGTPAAGTVPFNILQIQSLLPETTEYEVRDGYIITGNSAITDEDHYARCTILVGYAAAGRDSLLIRALSARLAYEMVRSIAGKDNQLAIKLDAEYNESLGKARLRDARMARGNEEQRGFWSTGQADPAPIPSYQDYSSGRY